MSFIAKHITHHDERLIYLTRPHWIMLLRGFFWFIALGALGGYINWLILFKFELTPSASLPFIPYPFSSLIDLTAGLVPILMGLMIFLTYLFKFLGTEIALTNKRLIYKTGLIFVQSSEVEIAEVSEARVDNGWFGVMFGYGTVTFDCRFVGDFTVSLIRNPYKVIRQMNKLRGIGVESPIVAKP